MPSNCTAKSTASQIDYTGGMRWLWLLVSPVVLASELWVPGAAFYRFSDESGRTQISDKIPPQAVARGYEVLDSRLFVLKTIPPQLTPAQLAQRDRKRAEQARLAQQAQQDQALLDRFPSVEDVTAAQRSEVRRIELQLDIQRRSLDIHEKSLASLQRKAAREERDGALSTQTLQALADKELDVLKARQAVADRSQALEDVQALYQARRERVALLTQQPR